MKNERSTDMRYLVSVLVLSTALTGCAGFPQPNGLPDPAMSDEGAAAAESDIEVAALDPLDAPPPPAAAPAAPEPAASPLLVPTETSQRVPLGTLNASSDPKPAARPPMVLVPPASSSQPSSSQPPSPPAPPPTPSAAPPAATVAQAPPAVPPAAPVEAPEPELTAEPAPTEPTASPNTFTLTIQPGVGPRTSPRGVPIPYDGPPRDAALEQASATGEPPPETAAAPPIAPAMEPEETMVISSATAPPSAGGREFVPASVVPLAVPPPPPAPGEMPFSQAERNVAKRFETLARLRDEGLVTQDEFNRRRAANLGALLPYSQNPPGVGLDRSVPGSDAISARLSALRRSFEMRAISPQQHALERTMILNALLPENPEQRTNRKPPPEDVLQGAAMVGRLESLREEGIISQSEVETERRMIDGYFRTGLFPPKGAEAAAKTAAAKPAAAKPAAPVASENPMETPITGPVLHLASFRSEAAARQGWEQVTTNNKTLLGAMKPIIRRVDLGQGRGIFYRLMAGSFPSLADAEATCVQLKQNNQFCRASVDGS